MSVAHRNPAQELVARVRSDEFLKQAALALPEGMPPQRFVRATVTALLENPELAQQASHESIFTALLRSAQDGLVPDGNEAAIVVYKGKAQYQAMIGGYRKIAGEHGWTLDTAVVKEADTFEYEKGLDPKVRHIIRPGDRGATVCAYCIARNASRAQPLVEVMMLDELEQIRATSKKPTSGPWKDWTDRMYEKTVGRRAFKKLPLGQLDQRVVRIQEAAEADPDEAATMIYGSVIDESLATAAAGSQSAGSLPALTSPAGEGPSQQAEAAGDSPVPPVVSAPGIDEEPGPAEASPFEQPASVGEDEHVFFAKAAADVVMPVGKWQGQTLGEIAANPNGPSYFRYALANFDDATGTGAGAEPRMRPGELVQAVYAFCRVFLPDLWQEATAAQEITG